MTSWRTASFAVVDLETTGLDPDVHEVLSIGVLDVVDGRIQVASAFYREVRPKVPPGSDTVVVHGIRPSQAARSGDPLEVGREVSERLRDRVLVAHVARIEQSFLSRWLRPLGWTPPRDVVDTDVLVRRWLARNRDLTMEEHVGLGAAAALFGLPEQARHHALGDALTTAQLFLALAHTQGDPSAQQLYVARRRRWTIGGSR